jgi:hypothetical protein
MRVTYEGECCVDCLLFLANGDDDSGVSARIANIWTPDEMAHMVVTSSEETDEEFSWRPCECCESELGGSRHGFAVLG